jgi:hypothetical protein
MKQGIDQWQAARSINEQATPMRESSQLKGGAMERDEQNKMVAGAGFEPTTFGL